MPSPMRPRQVGQRRDAPRQPVEAVFHRLCRGRIGKGIEPPAGGEQIGTQRVIGDAMRRQCEIERARCQRREIGMVARHAQDPGLLELLRPQQRGDRRRARARTRRVPRHRGMHVEHSAIGIEDDGLGMARRIGHRLLVLAWAGMLAPAAPGRKPACA